MEAGQLTYKNSVIGWRSYGAGPRKFACFHGYGEDASSYAFLEKHLGNQCRFIAIDLPFHGETEWKEGLLFTLEDLLQITELIVCPEEPGTGVFSLTGFSLGGRMALRLYQAIPDRIEKLVLIAPDGLKVNGWYWLATQTWLGNKFFAFTMKKPSWFFFFLKGLNKLGWVNTSIFKFVHFYIGDERARHLLYTRWTTLRKITPHLKQIKQKIKDKNTAVHLLYGRHDRIILPVVGERFRKGIEIQCRIDILPSGHQVLHEKHVADIIKALL